MRDPYLKATEPAKTIDEVIAHIDEVIEVSRRRRSRLGYFAALYRHVAVKFKATAESGGFKRPDLIDKLDVRFLNRYLEAIRQFQSGGTPSKSWLAAFIALDNPRVTTMQHLLLGMNAHINFDLGIAVANAVTKEELPDLRDDFEKMNSLLGGLLEVVETDLAQIEPILSLLHRLFGRTEDAIINFSMKETREHAWRFAEQLVQLDGDERRDRIARVDLEIATIGRLIRRPFFPISLAKRSVS